MFYNRRTDKYSSFASQIFGTLGMIAASWVTINHHYLTSQTHRSEPQTYFSNPPVSLTSHSNLLLKTRLPDLTLCTI